MPSTMVLPSSRRWTSCFVCCVIVACWFVFSCLWAVAARVVLIRPNLCAKLLKVPHSCLAAGNRAGTPPTHSFIGGSYGYSLLRHSPSWLSVPLASVRSTLAGDGLRTRLRDRLAAVGSVGVAPKRASEVGALKGETAGACSAVSLDRARRQQLRTETGRDAAPRFAMARSSAPRLARVATSGEEQ